MCIDKLGKTLRPELTPGAEETRKTRGVVAGSQAVRQSVSHPSPVTDVSLADGLLLLQLKPSHH
jgi:hypothetical protein